LIHLLKRRCLRPFEDLRDLRLEDFLADLRLRLRLPPSESAADALTVASFIAFYSSSER